MTLIDAGEPGMGATSHSFAWINSFAKEPRAYGGLNRRSLDTWDRFARLLDADIGLRWADSSPGPLPTRMPRRWRTTSRGCSHGVTSHG